MNAELLARLLQLDKLGWESQPDIDYTAEWERVEKVKPEIEKIIGHPLWLDKNVQDASFFAELAWLDEKFYVPGEGGTLVPHIAIRFSAFDHMATVYSANNDEKGLLHLEPMIAKALELNGFRFVSMKDLNDPYPGKETWMEGWTWFTRFFDYL